MQALMHKNMLRLACIDEVHQFVVFGCAFRPAFCLLKDSLFNCVISNDPNISNGNTTSNLAVKLKVPLLLMTATFNVELLSLVQSMIGMRVCPEMFLWSGRDAMQRHTVRISVSMSMQYLKSIKDILKTILAGNV